MALIPALGMIRVSSKRQERQGYSVPEQKRAIQNFADTHQIRIVEFVTEAKTGFTADRKDVRTMRALAEQGRIRAVVVFVMDRLSRGLEVQLALRSEIKRLKLQLYTTTRGLIEDTPEANLSSNVEGAFSQYQIDILVRGSIAGRRGKARAGKWPGGGHAPYGYRKEGLKGESRLVKVPAVLKVVQRIFNDYTQKRLGIRAIAEALNRERVPSPTGGVWWWSTVKRILSTRAYIGEIEYAGILIPLPELAVIERRQFDLAQRLKAQNKEFARRNRKHEYALSNRLLCACGRKMFGESGILYRCTSQNAPVAGTPEKRGQAAGHATVVGRCGFGKVYRSSIESVVWDHLREQLTPERLEQGTHQAQQKRKTRQPPAHAEEIERQIERLKKRIAVLMDDFSDDETLATVAADKIRTLSRDIKALEAERAGEQADQRDAALDEQARVTVSENAEQLREMLDDPDEVVRQKVLEALRVRVVLKARSDGRRGIVIETIFGRSKVIPIRHNLGR
jgi:site-specific DNA recombinase